MACRRGRGFIRPALLLATLLLAGVPAGAQDSIRIATEGAYPPFNYAENNEPAGFEVDLGRALCTAMEATCTFVLQDWDGMISGLRENRYDAVMSSLEITPERRKKVAFSKRYYRIPSALIGDKAEPQLAPGAKLDLKGKSVGAVADSEFAEYVSTTFKEATLRPFAKLEEANLDLLTDRIDYVLGDKLALSKFLASREGTTCCRFIADLPVDRGEGVGVAFRKSDVALREKFDAAIDKVVADGTYDRIRAKYFSFDVK